SPKSSLGQLKRVALGIADVTDLSEDAVVSYVLLGREPFLSPWRVRIQMRSCRLPDGANLSRPSIGFELHVQDVRWSELRRMYRDFCRIARRQHRAMKLTAREDVLRRVLASSGGVPSRSGAREAWNVVANRAGYPNGQAARVAYNRILRKERAI